MTISKKLEKIARQYRIDPATLPPVDGKSITVNISRVPQPAPASVPTPTKEARQNEHERLRAEAQAANKRLRDYEKAERDRLIAARARR